MTYSARFINTKNVKVQQGFHDKAKRDWFADQAVMTSCTDIEIQDGRAEWVKWGEKNAVV